MKKGDIGYCPQCYEPGVLRERRPGGYDECPNGHRYPSSYAMSDPTVDDDIRRRREQAEKTR